MAARIWAAWTWAVSINPTDLRCAILYRRCKPQLICGFLVCCCEILDDRLNGFSDRQIGQLLFEFCWPGCYFNSPELIIVTQAIDRLRRSTGGTITNEEAQDNLKQQPVCPKFGNEMFLHYGIDEPDFWLCDRTACRTRDASAEQ